MVKKSLTAQPLTVYYSIIGVNGKKILLTANFFRKRLIHFVNYLKINSSCRLLTDSFINFRNLPNLTQQDR